jgi:hypothetical protein
MRPLQVIKLNKMSYIYWNNFIDFWRFLPPFEFTNPNPIAPNNLIGGWTNPNLTPINGTLSLNDLTLQYLPEPWWGNNGNHALESVVINYNPAGLNEAYWGVNANQHYNHSRGLYGFADYSSFIDNEVLTVSNRFPGKYTFHFSNRAKRIFDSLNRNGVTLTENKLENHLSIELAPWYTPQSNLIFPYIIANIQNVYANCILFAANESTRIINPALNRKVIIRASRDSLLNLIPYFGTHVIIYDKTTPSGNGRWFKFSLNAIPNIEFICIWGPKSRNDFPPNSELDIILNNL